MLHKPPQRGWAQIREMASFTHGSASGGCDGGLCIKQHPPTGQIPLVVAGAADCRLGDGPSCPPVMGCLSLLPAWQPFQEQVSQDSVWKVQDIVTTYLAVQCHSCCAVSWGCHQSRTAQGRGQEPLLLRRVLTAPGGKSRSRGRGETVVPGPRGLPRPSAL